MCSKSPLLKQCFVASGVTINYMTHGFVIGYTSVLLPALRQSTKIPVNESSATWIASIFGISLILGTLTVPSVMGRFGRKPANIFSAARMTVGWFVIVLSSNVASLLLGRLLQGYSMGFLAILGSVLIGEYSSPKNRGALLASISLFIMIGVMITHAFGTFLTWQMLGLTFAVVSFLDLLIIIYSPESPSFLATQVFQWLRSPDEDEELEKLIKTNMSRNINKPVYKRGSMASRIIGNLTNFKSTFSKKEVFKPVLITLHLYAMNQWAGAMTFDAYTKDIVDVVVGKDDSFALVIVSLDIQRTISMMIGVVFVKKLRRKLLLGATMAINIFIYLIIALYVYFKIKDLLLFDHPLIGVIFLHIHMLSNAGTIIISNIIPGEIFPLEHRGSCAMVGILFFSINETINIKSAPYLFSSIGVHGAYLVYVGLVIYCFSVAWMMLPETKDRTLLNIEEGFRGEPLVHEDNLMVNHERNEIFS